MSYIVFKRTWWKKDPNTKALVPHLGRKTVVRRGIPSSEEARNLCEQFNKILQR